MRLKVVCLIAVVLISSYVVSGCKDELSSDEMASKDIFAMDTYMTLSAYGDERSAALDDAISEIGRLDKLLDAQDSESDIYKLNESHHAFTAYDTGYLIERSKKIYKDSKHLFDIAVYPLMKEWGFTTGKYKIPDRDVIDKLLSHMDVSKLDISSKKPGYDVSLPDDMQIDLGGIAKGYASDKVMDIYRKYGITSGIVSLGGNVRALGSKPDGSKWSVGIREPDGDGESLLGVVKVSDKAVITSGGYERYFDKGGKRYHHIIDPRTGYPAESGLKSVTIVCEDATLADALSTSVFIMGVDEGIKLWRSDGLDFDMVMLDDKGELRVTEGIYEDFTSDTYEKKPVKK